MSFVTVFWLTLVDALLTVTRHARQHAAGLVDHAPTDGAAEILRLRDDRQRGEDEQEQTAAQTPAVEPHV